MLQYPYPIRLTSMWEKTMRQLSERFSSCRTQQEYTQVGMKIFRFFRTEGHRFDLAILHPKSTVLRWKYSAFLFAEVGFWGLHCFACTVFRLLQAVPIQPPTFDFTPFSKRNVCRPVFQQAAASSPSMYGVRSKLKVMLS